VILFVDCATETDFMNSDTVNDLLIS